MKKPLVGIVVGYATDPRTNDPKGKLQLGTAYVERVLEAGGESVLVAPGSSPEFWSETLDALLITGGDDIDPSRYGQQPHPRHRPEPAGRYEAEEALYRRMAGRKPVLGICYGCQFLNVVEGGTLIQHLPDSLGDERHMGDPVHEHRLAVGSLLHGIIKRETCRGKSWHHQTVDTVPPSLRPVAWYEDGTIEAVESADGAWIIGVQWHPERTDVPESTDLFQALVEAAALSNQSEVSA